MFIEQSVHGNIITGGISNGPGHYTLPDGYSAKKVTFVITPLSEAFDMVSLRENDKDIAVLMRGNRYPGPVSVKMEFPIVDGKSPCTFDIRSLENGNINCTIIINEIGGTPDVNYFANEFQPSDYNNLQVPHNRKE